MEQITEVDEPVVVNREEGKRRIQEVLDSNPWPWGETELKQHLEQARLEVVPESGHRAFYVHAEDGCSYVLKTGPYLAESEIAVQYLAAQQNLAVPPLYLGQVTDLPLSLQNDLLADGYYHYTACRVAIMPMAEPIHSDNIYDYEQEFDVSVSMFMNDVEKFLWDTLHYTGWERAWRHVMVYEGHFVAIDFEGRVGVDY